MITDTQKINPKMGVKFILNGILKGLFEWLYEMFLELVSYCANSLLGLMSADLTYFETNVPAVSELYNVMIAVG